MTIEKRLWYHEKLAKCAYWAVNTL